MFTALPPANASIHSNKYIYALVLAMSAATLNMAATTFFYTI
tara:strand:+ start:492 stop:617 length:126 start_codon:yes stop_codon:yes gene_type:complete